MITREIIEKVFAELKESEEKRIEEKRRNNTNNNKV